MFRLLRYFSLTSLVAFAIVIAVLATISNRAAVRSLTELEESKNVALTRAFANSIWPEFRQFLTMAAATDAESLRSNPEIHRLRLALATQAAGLAVVKVKIYDLDGLTVFSSEAAQIGEDKSGNAGFQAARGGQLVSELTHRDSFSAFEGTIEDRDVLSSYVPVYTDGRIEGVFEIYSDVTPLLARIQETQRQTLVSIAGVLGLLYLLLVMLVRRADQVIYQQAEALNQARLVAETANRAKSEFTGIVAHELKTPIAVIRSYTDLLQRNRDREGGDESRHSRYLEIIQTNLERMTSLASDLADVARIEAGLLHLELEPVPLAALVEEVTRSIQRHIDQKGQTLVVRLPEGLPPVWGDRQRLAQILVNLVSNANKYTPDGGQIIVRAAVDGDDQEVQVAVQDTGLGMREEEQAMVFQSFFRSEDEAVRAQSGTGLGLNITKNLVELLGGRIWFESTFRQGTTFYVALPASA